MDAEKLFNERIELINDAVRMKNIPERVPFISNDAFWKYYDLGYKLSETLFDYQKMEDAHIDFQNRYQFDLHLGISGGRNPLTVTRSLGNFQYNIDDKNNILFVHEQCHFKEEDYDKFIANPAKTLWEEIIPRKYTYFKSDMKLETLQNTLAEFFKNSKAMQKTSGRLMSECGLPPLTAPQNGSISLAFECLYSFLRGMKALSGDLRRCPEKVLEFINVFHNLYTKPSIDKLTLSSPLNSGFSTMGSMLSHNVINNKQFEKFYWPHFKELTEKILEIDGTMFILSEGTTMHITEYLQDLPKGHFCIYVEMDDIFDRRKRFQNLCLWGGIPINLLSKGTKQDCIDHVKKVIDEVGGNGGLLLATDKFASCPNDCNRENLLAISEFVRNYTKEKNYV